MQIQHSNEIELIRQTLTGNTSAFDQLVNTHRRTIYVLVFSYIKNPADAEDLTQRIFIRAYEQLATLRQLDHFLPWIQQIAHNACKDWLRHRSDSTIDFEAVNDADFTKTAPSPEEIALKREIESVVREAISALQDTDRKLVEGPTTSWNTMPYKKRRLPDGTALIYYRRRNGDLVRSIEKPDGTVRKWGIGWTDLTPYEQYSSDTWRDD
jgi:RNA polymerase sigma-70 factor (ECF subfamily)